MQRISKTEGLIAATFTPFAADGSVEAGVVPRYAAHLRSQGVGGPVRSPLANFGKERLAWLKPRVEQWRSRNLEV